MDIMPPDNQLPPHHAPTGLKLWLAIFAVVLVVALGYLVWASNTAPDTTDNSAATVKKSTTIETIKTTTGADKTTLTDTKFGFSITYPKSWSLDKMVGYLESADLATAYFGRMETRAKLTNDPNPLSDWRVTVYEKPSSTHVNDLKLSAQEPRSDGAIHTDLNQGTATIGDLTAITLSWKIEGKKSLFYFLTKDSLLFEIATDGSAEQMAVAETFKFTK